MKQKRKKRICFGILAAVIIVLIVLLLLRSCGGEEIPPPPPSGDFEVTDDPRPETTPPAPDDSQPEATITFAVQLKYEVSAQSPEIELRNPEGNFVDFVFALTDVRSGELIARTDRVRAGKYVYVNVVDFYSAPGIYDVALTINTYDAQSGTQMNGLDQTVKVVVKK